MEPVLRLKPVNALQLLCHRQRPDLVDAIKAFNFQEYFDQHPGWKVRPLGEVADDIIASIEPCPR